MSQYDGIIAFHALRSGRHLCKLSDPREASSRPRVSIVFGGTDVNESDWTPEQEEAMTTALTHADATIAFNEELKSRAEAKWPKWKGCLACRVIAPSIEKPFGGLGETSRLEHIRSEPSAVSQMMTQAGVEWDHTEGAGPILLLVSGIREVKDPIFAVLATRHSRWASLSREGTLAPRLVVIGPKRGCSYQTCFEEALDVSPQAWYLPAVAQEMVHRAMLECSAVLNVSVSEGASNALLEAMALGRPVIAKNIPGNASLVVPGETGLLFDTEDSYLDAIAHILKDEAEAERLGQGGKRRFDAVYSLEAEAAAYKALVEDMLSSRTVET